MSMKWILFSIIKIKWMNLNSSHGNISVAWAEWMSDSKFKDDTKPCELELHLYHLIPQVVAGGRSSPDCPLNIPPGCWPLATWPPGLRGPGAAS